MSQADPYGDQPYADEPYAQPQPAEKSGSTINLPTIVASAGVAAVVSALIVTIGVVGLATSGNFRDDTAAAQPTVVNLGSEQGVTTPNGTTAQQVDGEPTADDAPAEAPTEDVPESDGDAGTGSGTEGAGATAIQGTSGQGATEQGTTTKQSATPAPLSAGQLNTKVKKIMNTNASNAARADEVEGGQKALGSIDAVAGMLKVSGAGFSYKVVGPVTQNGTTLNARLQMSLVGNGSRYRELSWVWVDNKWKLSNKSVCVIAQYAMLKCTV